MNKHYSQMTEVELHDEVLMLAQHIRVAKEANNEFELPILEQKMLLVKSYLVDPSTIHPGDLYAIDEEPGSTFRIHHLKGVFAWGNRNDESEMTGLILAKLGQKLESALEE